MDASFHWMTLMSHTAVLFLGVVVGFAVSRMFRERQLRSARGLPFVIAGHSALWMLKEGGGTLKTACDRASAIDVDLT